MLTALKDAFLQIHFIVQGLLVFEKNQLFLKISQFVRQLNRRQFDRGQRQRRRRNDRRGWRRQK